MKGKILALADRMLTRSVIAPVFVAALVASGAPAAAAVRPASAHAPHRAPKVTTIKVTIHGSIFVLSANTAPRGIVIFKCTDIQIYGHRFSIDGHATRVLKQGQSETLRVTFLRKGRYPYKDTMDHHAQWGLHGVFTIT